MSRLYSVYREGGLLGMTDNQIDIRKYASYIVALILKIRNAHRCVLKSAYYHTLNLRISFYQWQINKTEVNKNFRAVRAFCNDR